jgi:hypothetical protein
MIPKLDGGVSFANEFRQAKTKSRESSGWWITVENDCKSVRE